MVKPRVSEFTASRLSLYLRYLSQLEETGIDTVSSKAMAEHLHLNSSQVRKDLACFGEFGVRGVGYRVRDLRRQIERILGLDRTVRVVIVGAGNLGSALAGYAGFNGGGFEIVALFDVDPRKVGGITRSGKPVHSLERLKRVVGSEGVEVGIVAVPAEAAQEVVDLLVGAGVRAVLNFAPVRPRVPERIRCKNVDLKVELETLSFFLAESELAEGSAVAGSSAAAR